ncbi:ComEC/Rec2 family competence protein [Moheibacter sediminis]|uniref:Competence protein ComEC n=1 Tax=Moheibacter sediminis TaxID=1434700 RepID=A0A1W2BGF7_9FLAO|nr:ComEC/Rec2 family competence protein [Moheibacter sediminis]SMC71914.1 competence protein ComEC [Moheibacter sediminis]
MKDQPFLFPLLGMISGILLGQFLHESDWRFLELIVLTAIIFILIFKSKFYFLGSLSILLFFTFFGIIRFHHFNSKEELNSDLLNEKKWVKLKIENTYRSSEKYRKYKAEIIFADSISTQKTHLLLYWKKENQQLHANDKVWVYTKIHQTEPPKNPHQFDYQKYLSRQQIHYTSFSGSVYYIELVGNSWNNKAAKFKSEIRIKLLSFGYSKNATDIIGAMLLGDRTEMDPEVEESYRKTGVVHILSISGLHIVMVYTIFYFLFYPLIYLQKGKLLRIICSLIFIWLYALFVELQPPVARSALMITIFHLALVFRRKPNIYHTLALSAFVLLIINPNFIFDVGFQLSYAAVFFIVWLMPVYRKILPFKNRKLIYMRDFTGTSISAQMGTFPIAAFYFHQSSGLFLAGNILMIPASFLMILGGMFSVLLAWLDIDFEIWIQVFNGFFWLCNWFINWLSSHENLVFENISFNILEVYVLLFIILGIRFLVMNYSPKYFISILTLFLIFQLSRIHKNYSFGQKEEFIVFNQYKNSILGIRKGKKLDVFISDEIDSAKINQYIIKPYCINEIIDSIHYFNMENEMNLTYAKSKNIIVWNGKKILIVNRDLDIKTNDFDYILIQNSSEIHSDSISNKTEVILDGSSYPNHLENSEFKLWRTRDSGAKVITVSR